ncbi:MAG: hypothetical protein ABIP12_06105, partial [Terriglobales bacterium]
VLYLSRWSSPAMAQRFADVYARSFKIKYTNATPHSDKDGSGKWKSEEGPLTVEVIGDRLLVMEGFDAETAAKLRAAVLSNQPATEQKTARTGNLSLKTVAPVFAVRLMMRH